MLTSERRDSPVTKRDHFACHCSRTGSSLIRLVALAVSGAIVFAGFGTPFLVPGTKGLVIGLILVLAGSIALWIAQRLTVHSLDADTAWNRFIKTDVENDGDY